MHAYLFNKQIHSAMQTIALLRDFNLVGSQDKEINALCEQVESFVETIEGGGSTVSAMAIKIPKLLLGNISRLLGENLAFSLPEQGSERYGLRILSGSTEVYLFTEIHY